MDDARCPVPPNSAAYAFACIVLTHAGLKRLLPRARSSPPHGQHPHYRHLQGRRTPQNHLDRRPRRLAGAAAATLSRCCDVDPNCGFSGWYARSLRRRPLAVSAESRSIEVVDHAQAEADRHHIVLLDTAGFQNLTAASAITVADFVLIPAMPDAGSVVEAIKTIRQAAVLPRIGLPAGPFLAPSGCSLRRPPARSSSGARRRLLEAGVPIPHQRPVPPSPSSRRRASPAVCSTAARLIETAIAEIAAGTDHASGIARSVVGKC